jgi:hypothetical protein
VSLVGPGRPTHSGKSRVSDRSEARRHPGAEPSCLLEASRRLHPGVPSDVGHPHRIVYESQPLRAIQGVHLLTWPVGMQSRRESCLTVTSSVREAVLSEEATMLQLHDGIRQMNRAHRGVPLR